MLCFPNNVLNIHINDTCKMLFLRMPRTLVFYRCVSYLFWMNLWLLVALNCLQYNATMWHMVFQAQPLLT